MGKVNGISLPSFKETGIPKNIQIELLHVWNRGLLEEGVITEELYKKVRAKIDRL